MARIANVYADGFGRWTATVRHRPGESPESSGGIILARMAIRDELRERAAQYPPLACVRVRRVEWMDYTDTSGERFVYYRESDEDDES